LTPGHQEPDPASLARRKRPELGIALIDLSKT